MRNSKPNCTGTRQAQGLMFGGANLARRTLKFGVDCIGWRSGNARSRGAGTMEAKEWSYMTATNTTQTGPGAQNQQVNTCKEAQMPLEPYPRA
jgi:hypothetical protein